ncbi:hypothetical protein JYU34_007192 [Plutella xylostella]|uniref:Uncharacterized protein n=1 Tax=Plutella xylostella TaxID=51655 RepID=A0ABQ7QPS6_PLUXY|nr:hypothetical protein JYU34_007192 [Plutella xylostella]
MPVLVPVSPVYCAGGRGPVGPLQAEAPPGVAWTRLPSLRELAHSIFSEDGCVVLTGLRPIYRLYVLIPDNNGAAATAATRRVMSPRQRQDAASCVMRRDDNVV